MADRLRDLIDLVLGSLDEPGADGRALARRASFSRDHLDRLLAAAATLPAESLARPLRPGFVAVWFEGEEASAAQLAERLVFTARGLGRRHGRRAVPGSGRRPAP